MLETEITKLQNEIEARANHQSKPDLSTSPAPEYHRHHQHYQQHQELASQFSGLPIFQAPGFQQSAAAATPGGATVVVLPMQSELHTQDISAGRVQQTQAPLMCNSSNVSKPCPRYASAADSWPSRLLGERLRASE